MRLSKEQSKSLATTVRKFHPLASPEAAGVALAGAEALAALGFVVRGSECVEWGMSTQGSGYGNMGLQVGRNKTRIYTTHKAVREVWDGGVASLLVLHRCGNKLCLNVDHTYLGTESQNGHDRIRMNETPQVGDSHRDAKLNRELVRELRALHAAGGVSMSQLAREYGVTRHTMQRAIKGQTWQH